MHQHLYLPVWASGVSDLPIRPQSIQWRLRGENMTIAQKRVLYPKKKGTLCFVWMFFASGVHLDVNSPIDLHGDLFCMERAMR